MPAKILIIIILTMCSAIAASSVEGYVKELNGRPVEQALLEFGQSRTFSSRDGFFKLEGEADSLRVSRLGFEPLTVTPQAGVMLIVLKAAPYELPAVRVTESYLSFTPSAADLLLVPIDPDRHYYSATQMLGEASGVSSSETPLRGETQGIRLLGNLPRHSLIVLDGIPLNAEGESYDISLLDPQNIEKIEIIKNNASVYGGAAAIGGVVLISSKRGKLASGTQYRAGIELGSYGYANIRMALRGNLGSTAYRLAVGKFNADNDFSYTPREWWNMTGTSIRHNNAKRQNSLAGSLSTRFGKALLTISSDLEQFHRQLPGTVNFSELYRNAWLEGQATRNRLSLEAPIWLLNSRFLLWHNADSSVYDNTSAPLPVFLSRYRQGLWNSGIKLSIDKGEGLVRTSIGIEAGSTSYLNDNLLSDTPTLRYQAEQASFSSRAGIVKDGDKLGISSFLAGRYDLTANEKVPSWRAEIELRHHGWLESSWGATWGTAFAMPSPYDLYWKGDSQAIGNPELSSERSRGGQLWAAVKGWGISLRGAVHLNRIRDLIQWRQVQMFGNAWKPFNIGEAELRNLELEAGWNRLNWLELSGNALFTDARDLSTMDFATAPRLMYTPECQLSATARIKLNKQDFWVKYSHTGRQWTTPDNLSQPVDGFELLDAGLEASFTWQGWQMNPHLNIHNILNRRYEVYPYVPQPGITVYGGLELRSEW